MWNKAKKLLSLLLALVMVCSLAAVPVSAADTAEVPTVSLPSTSAYQRKYIYADSEYKAEVTVTPPANITYGHELGTPSATATFEDKEVPDAKFTYAYEGVDETEYALSAIPPTDAGKYQVTATLITPGYSGSATGEFTISKVADPVTTEAWVFVPNGEEKTIQIDEMFIKSYMAKGAKIKTKPDIGNDTDDLIESSTAEVDTAEFKLKSKDNANPGSSQSFTLVLTTDNYEMVNVTVTVVNETVEVSGAQLIGDKTEFPSGTALKDIIDLTDCRVTINDSEKSGALKLVDSDMKLIGPNAYTDWSVLVQFTTPEGTKYQVPVSVPDFTILEPTDIKVTMTVAAPDNLVYTDSETLWTPSIMATIGDEQVDSQFIEVTYEGISGTEYAENTIRPTDAGTYRVTAKLMLPGYSGLATDDFTIKKAESATTEAYICVPNGETKTFMINEWFIPSNMAKGASILKTPDIATGDGNLIESHSANANATEFTLTSKNGAPANSRQEFQLILTSNNYKIVTVTVIVYNDNVEITGAALKDDKTEFPSGTPWKDIVDLSECTATVNDIETQGTFDLMEPDTVTGPNRYPNWPVVVLFTTETTGITYQVTVYLPSFTVLEPEDGIDNLYKNVDPIYLILYANSTYNQSGLNGLIEFIKKKKSTHVVGKNNYPASWQSDNNLSFNPKGLQLNGPVIDYWYSYTATLEGSSIRPKAYVTVIPVNASPSLIGSSSKALKATDITALTDDTAMRSILGLPNSVNVSYERAAEPQNVTEDFKGASSDTWNISGWKMDDRDLTLDILKGKANDAASQDVKVMLTPVFAGAPVWATTVSSPVFELTITPKTPVGVSWDGPADITYGEKLELDTPTQKDDGGGTDPSGTWDFVYYNKADGTKLSGQPTNAGTYQVQAVLVSATHSGTSALMEFRINPKELTAEGITAERAANDDLVYNKQPQTPEYIVKDGEKTLIKGTDYTVAYTDNINAGNAAVIFTGIGNYTDEKKETFIIKRFPLTENQRPDISGTAAAGQVLSASLLGVDAAELEWSWAVDGVEVKDCIAASYEVKPENSNKTITVKARAKDGGNYSGTSGDSDSMIVAKFRITGTVAITAPKVGGDGRIEAGTELAASASVTPSAAVSEGVWSWMVDGVEKAAGSSTYTVEKDDREIVAVFTPSENYTGTIESASIEVGKILLIGTVTINTGEPVVGSELTVTTTPPIDGDKLAYTWLRNGEPIPDANDDTYTIAAEDRGKTISVKVTAEGYTGELISEGTFVPVEVPRKPGVTVTAGDKKLTINWSAPADNGGAPVTGYKLKVTENETLLDITLAANILSYTLEGLTNGTEYSISVLAVNSAGDGEIRTVDGVPRPSGNSGNDDNGDDDNDGDSDGSVCDRRPVSSSDSSDDSDNPTVSSTTTTNPDGSKVTIEMKRDGSVVTTVQSGDGRSAVIITDPSGLTSATVYLTSLVAGRAANGSSIVTLPVQGIYASQNIDRVSAVTVDTSGVNGVKVDIPLVNKGVGVVAVLVNPDGSEKIIKNTIPTHNGIAVRLNHGDTIKILDNSMSFSDIGGHWASDEVNFVSARGLFCGTQANIFSPDAEMTRGMLVTVLARYADVDTEGGATWYEKGVAWAVSNGLSDGTNLEDSITREQLSAIMYRYARSQGKLSGIGADLQAYTDADRISDWAVDAMSWAVGAGLIKGVAPATLDPQGSASRAQVSAIIMRYAELFGL